ncbi:MAG: class I SAM-dependent methyltransferase [Deltaproteobacteria bacterium]|nr:class I SAM-dependent methyltransferase [Deltaproteobacteria bacterium]
MNCPYCKASGNFYFKVASSAYNRCTGCDLIYKEDQDSYDNVLAHYRDDYFGWYSADQMNGNRDRLFGRILDLIEKKGGTGRLLDIGAGCGRFLTAAQKRGWTVKGIEPSIQSVEVARGQYGLDIYNGAFQEYDEDGKFDVITLINVLDHSVGPWEEIGKVYSLLKPGGIIYLRFPNGLFHSFLFKTSESLNIERIIRKFLVFHEYCFTPGFIRRLLPDQGFANVEVCNASLSGESLISSFPAFSFVTRPIEVVKKLTGLISGGKVLWCPSLEVIARKK